jgi:hypothetical protein
MDPRDDPQPPESKAQSPADPSGAQEFPHHQGPEPDPSVAPGAPTATSGPAWSAPAKTVHVARFGRRWIHVITAVVFVVVGIGVPLLATRSPGSTSSPIATASPGGSSTSDTWTASETTSVTSRPFESPPDSGRALNDKDLQAFINRCRKSQDVWRDVKIDWPQALDVPIGDSVEYMVVADAASQPAPATAVIPGKDVRSDSATVQCTLGARLTSVDKSVGVYSDSSQGDWTVQQFNPGGKLYWSWTISSQHAGDHQLRLELRPVAAVVQPALNGNAGDVYTGTATSTFQQISTVHVLPLAQPTAVATTATSSPAPVPAEKPKGDFIQRLADWIQEHKGPLAVIGAFIVAVVIATLTAIREVRKKFREVFRKRGRRSPGAKPIRAQARAASDARADGNNSEPRSAAEKSATTTRKATANAAAGTVKKAAPKKQTGPKQRGASGPGIDLSVHDEKQDQGK